MHKLTNSSLEANPLPIDTPEDMLKRVFAVAELIAKSKTQQGNVGQRDPELREKTQKDEPVVL